MEKGLETLSKEIDKLCPELSEEEWIRVVNYPHEINDYKKDVPKQCDLFQNK